MAAFALPHVTEHITSVKDGTAPPIAASAADIETKTRTERAAHDSDGDAESSVGRARHDQGPPS
jgi:hypothetical protein